MGVRGGRGTSREASGNRLGFFVHFFAFRFARGARCAGGVESDESVESPAVSFWGAVQARGLASDARDLVSGVESDEKCRIFCCLIFWGEPFLETRGISTVAVRWNFLGERRSLWQSESGRGSASGLCWRATRPGIPCRDSPR